MGFTIFVQRKYSIYTKFLDTVLEAEDMVQDGETRLEAMSRLRRDLDATADEWRKEAVVNETIQESHQQFPPIGPPSPMPIIDKDVEKLEILIDNAQTAADLAQFKEEASKHNLVSLYMERLKQLTNVFKIELNKNRMSVWPLGGFAPGSYWCTCAICGEEFTGDKHSLSCLECAVESANNALDNYRGLLNLH